MTSPRAAIPTRTQQTQIQFSPTIPTNQQFQGPPVTPTDKYNRVVKLPVMNLPPCPAPLTQLSPHKLFIAQFRTILEPWQKPLFGSITQCHPTPMLRDCNQDHQPIILVSDASVQKNKQSSFAWVLTCQETTLWKGIGLTPGHTEDIYSGRAEAFGVLAGLLFLQHYITSYDLTQFTDSPLTCFCDNAGVINNVNDLLSIMITRPYNSTNDDQDVYLAISEMPS